MPTTIPPTLGAGRDGNRRDQVRGVEEERTGRDDWNWKTFSGSR